MNFQSLDDLVNYINTEIKDDALKNLIFETEFVSARRVESSIIQIIHNLLQVQFLLLYVKWRSLSAQEKNAASFTHSTKVFKVLSEVYKQQEMNFDVLIYVLSEAQRDVVDVGDKSMFREFFSSDAPCIFSRYYDVLDYWVNGDTNSDDEKSLLDFDLFELLCDLIKNAQILSKVYLERESTNAILCVENRRYALKGLIYYDEDGLTYLLNRTHEYIGGMKFEFVCTSNFNLRKIVDSTKI